MGFTDKVRAWLRRESDEAAQLLAETERRLDDDLTRRERELEASPQERLESLQRQIEQNDAELEAIRERLRRGTADPDPDPGPG
jgi:DNA repair ATPase RecN